MIDFPLLEQRSEMPKNILQGEEDLYFGGHAPSGTLMTLLQQAVEEAQEMVAFQTLLLDSSPLTEALLRAIQRGVRVYGILADEPLRKLAEEGEKHRHEESFRKLIRELAPRSVMRTSTHIHGKYLVIDPHLPTGKGFFLTANLTEKALTHNLEVAKLLKGEALRQLFEHFVYTFWEFASEEFTEAGSTHKVKPLERYRFPSAGKLIPSRTPEGQYPLFYRMEELIQKSRSHLVLSTFLIAGVDKDPVRPVVEALKEATRRGVKVEIFYPYYEKVYQSQIFPALKPLVEAGAEVHLISEPLLHAKFLLSDSKRGLLLTANLEGGKQAAESLDLGWELGVDEVEKLEENFLPLLRALSRRRLVHQVALSSLSEGYFYQVKGGSEQKVPIHLEIVLPERIALQRVEDLLNFYHPTEGPVPENDDKYARQYRIDRTGDVPPLPSHAETKIKDKREGFTLITLRDKRGEREAILLSPSFTPEMVEHLRPFRSLPLYYGEPKKASASSE